MPRDRPPGIWESLKRALSGAEPSPEPPPAPSLPKQSEPEARPDVTSSAPPFLLPDEPSPAPSPAIADPPRVSRPAESPPTPAVPVPPPAPVQAPEGPRLARGLASFSRSNADREKKFAHLLHDDAPGEKKKPQPPGGRE